MRLFILAVGNKMPDWVSEGFNEYVKRMPRELKIELLEIKPEKRSEAKATAAILEAERERIAAVLPANSEIVALDERGKNLSTVELAEALEGWQREGRNVAFVIGGADGLHADLKQGAGSLLSLSRMTLPHGLARIFLAEQLYRAMSILRHHPYHRA
ncbi:MAG: 23S rRNA (pseudouridine(1915)-N(3))-methyltransferase RlmH [Burkholderiales bacterium]